MVELELVVAGHCIGPERLMRGRGGWRRVEFPSSVAVVRHPSGGVLLFDTGYAPRFAERTTRWPYRLYRMLLPVTCRPEDALLAQLATRRVPPRQVSTIVLSHLHGDHVAGLLDFPGSRIVLGPGALPAGWRGRSAWANAAHGFVPGLLPADLERRTVPATTLPVRPTGLGGRLRNGYDLTGDGEVMVLPLPGHTAGHLGMWLPGVGPDGVLLAGDACWNRRAFTHGELPHPLVLRAMHDPGGYRGAIAELARLHRSRPGLIIVPSHCPASIAAARAALGG